MKAKIINASCVKTDEIGTVFRSRSIVTQLTAVSI
jgi:hypothetical protein